MVYDCFTFFNELDLLEIRLNELAGVVDRFVLVEVARTFTNQPKPLYFAENRSRFAAFADRIIHVTVDDMPGGDDPWAREKHQRSCIIRGLSGCRDEDTIIVTDADEIPRATAIARSVNDIFAFDLQLSYYFLNLVSTTRWAYPAMLPFGMLRQMPSVQHLRERRVVSSTVENAGWHFSYLGDVERIRNKIQSFSHTEFNRPEFIDPANLRRAIAEGRDPYGREHQRFEVADPRSLPMGVVQNLNLYRRLLWSDFAEQDRTGQQLQTLLDQLMRVRELIGDVIQIGAADGQSASALANACHPAPLVAVDDWESRPGRLDRFQKNIKSLTLGNVITRDTIARDFLTKHANPIKFCHFTALRSPGDLRQEIDVAMKHLLPGGILCGDFSGELDAAINEQLPGLTATNDIWVWQRPTGASFSPSETPRHSRNPLNYTKSGPYYDWDRQDVRAVIVNAGIKPKKAVELGCSTGLFGEALKTQVGIDRYIGVEFSPEAAREAAGRLDQVHTADLESTTPANLGLSSNDIDLVLTLDVLEHLENPWDVLAAWAGVLRPGGHVVASIPNIQNISVLLSLVGGRWDYETAGLLDATHLRYFTLASIQQLFAGAGLTIMQISSILRPEPASESLKDQGNVLQMDNLTLSNLSRQQVTHLCTYQYIVVAQKPA